MKNLATRSIRFMLILDRVIFYLFCIYALTLCIFSPNVMAVLLLVVCCVRFAIQRPEVRFHTHHLKLILFFLMAVFCSNFFNDVNREYEHGLDIFRNDHLRAIVPLFFLAFFAGGKEKAKIIFLCLLVSFSIASLYGYFEYFVQGADRIRGLTEHYMALAGILALLCPVCFLLSFYSERFQRQRLCFMIVTLLEIPVIFFNGTRMTWLAIAILIPVILFQFVKNRKKLCFYVVLFIAIFSLLITQHARFTHFFDLQYQSNSERILMWKSAWTMFEEHPIFGVGIGNVKSQYRDKYISSLSVERTPAHMHNEILQVLATYGGIGFLAYIAMFGYFLNESYMRWERTREIEALIFFIVTSALLIIGLADVYLPGGGKRNPTQVYWLLVGIYMASIADVKVFHKGK